VTIGVLHLSFLVHGARSLKDKRRVISSFKAHVRNRFNCAIAETDYQDMWQRAQFTACVVSNDSRHANEKLDEIARFAGMNRDAELVNYEIELI
jgi:uncharacterized protein YlxP (DUF503 family)